jgi:hypothetical protein
MDRRGHFAVLWREIRYAESQLAQILAILDEIPYHRALQLESRLVATYAIPKGMYVYPRSTYSAPSSGASSHLED